MFITKTFKEEIEKSGLDSIDDVFFAITSLCEAVDKLYIEITNEIHTDLKERNFKNIQANLEQLFYLSTAGTETRKIIEGKSQKQVQKKVIDESKVEKKVSQANLSVITKDEIINSKERNSSIQSNDNVNKLMREDSIKHFMYTHANKPEEKYNINKLPEEDINQFMIRKCKELFNAGILKTEYLEFITPRGIKSFALLREDGKVKMENNTRYLSLSEWIPIAQHELDGTPQEKELSISEILEKVTVIKGGKNVSLRSLM